MNIIWLHIYLHSKRIKYIVSLHHYRLEKCLSPFAAPATALADVEWNVCSYSIYAAEVHRSPNGWGRSIAP